MSEQDMIALMKRMQQQLTFLEKKMDILISKSEAQRSSSDDRPFKSRRGGPKRGFDKKKKVFTFKRKERE